MRVRLRVRFHRSSSRRCSSSASSTGKAQVAIQNGDGGGRDAGDSGGLAERYGTYTVQFGLYLAGESGDSLILEFYRNRAAFGVFQPLDLPLPLLDVAAVFDFGLDSRKQDAGRVVTQNLPDPRDNFLDGYFGPLEPLAVGVRFKRAGEALVLLALRFEQLPSLIGDESGAAADRSQARVGIVDT